MTIVFPPTFPLVMTRPVLRADRRARLTPSVQVNCDSKLLAAQVYVRRVYFRGYYQPGVMSTLVGMIKSHWFTQNVNEGETRRDKSTFGESTLVGMEG